MQMTVQQWMNSPEKPDIFKPFRPDGDIDMGLVRFDSEANVFRIYMGQGYNGTYDMEADRILSGGGFLDFLLQVHSKEWVTGQHLKDLLDCVTCWTYRDHGKFPQRFFEVTGGMNRDLDDPNAAALSTSGHESRSGRDGGLHGVTGRLFVRPSLCSDAPNDSWILKTNKLNQTNNCPVLRLGGIWIRGQHQVLAGSVPLKAKA